MRGHRAPFVSVLIFLVGLAIGVGASVHAQPAPTTGPALYDGETLLTAAGYPALYRSIPADKSKPLLVFVPGDGHLARIFYGYPGGHDEDFVSRWVNRAGYPFLAVSYPLGNAVFRGSYPGYTIEDWGNQVAEVVAKVIDEQGLSKRVIICGWSMGGKIAASVGRAAKAKGFTIDAFVAMSADPPVPGFLPAANGADIQMTPAGYADREPIYNWFFNAVGQQNAYNGHTIIPQDIYRRDFLGATPVALIDSGLVFQDNKFVENVSLALRTAGTFDFAAYPFPVVVHDDSPYDAENALLDPGDWAFIRNRVLAEKYRGGTAYTDLTQPQWERLRLMVASSGSDFSETVEGNHFFFIGSIGARATVEKILRLYARVQSIPSIAATSPK
jgi:pimeloyl-ACP methyl ester carboxylesterase